MDKKNTPGCSLINKKNALKNVCGIRGIKHIAMGNSSLLQVANPPPHILTMK